MIVEEDEVAPNDTSLQPSQSATSLAGLGDSPQPAPATLFRPPQPRNTPVSASQRPLAGRNAVKKFADLLKLSKENVELVQKVYEFAGGSGSKWVPGRLIRDTFKGAIGEFILRPSLQAFSRTVAANHTTLVDSLEVLTFNYLKQLDPEIVDEQCAGDYIAGEACIPGTAMYSFIKEALKNQRSKVRSVLLTNILGVKEDSALTVLSAKSVVLLVARTFIPKLKDLGDKALMIKLGPEKVRWIIFMRYVTAYHHLNHTENKRHCQWTIMDEALADLRERPDSDRPLFLNEIVWYDREAFNGKRTWATIKASDPLRAPVPSEVLASLQANPGGGSGSGDMETEEVDDGGGDE
ncbi:uncharacterized protein MELLADRAFT_91347 [Melampsora larici-populina 98AG31]|uniref:Uncharacterized protein n=1 Tax=Melampsora larici-populina (strain 98AG31 / pathotype 3-4-7) TaxID=747676 RepID=F4RYQ8_MELLP|nr:uncharacterized protein MELLADRAFT_91347 [Melampsora larici-populina 98AG31]EGG02513.1 hypothetical protein MELLADRAFT_91347 [Melampsora larici-populina 98AG31]